MTIGRDRRYFVELNKQDILVEGYDNAGRQEDGLDETTIKNIEVYDEEPTE